MSVDPRARFDFDLAHGEARESAFVAALTRCHVEHKCDDWAPATGNVGIEISCRGKPSGISVTSADWWSVEVQDDTWLTIRTSLLRAIVDYAVAEGRVKMVGDGGASRVALVPIGWLVGGVMTRHLK